jgi:hypothetical protein
VALKGLTKTDDAADEVDYQVAVNKSEAWQTYEDWGSTSLLDGRLPQRTKVRIDTATLVVDIYRGAKKLIWTGSAQKTIAAKGGPEQVPKAVQALLNRFPRRQPLLNHLNCKSLTRTKVEIA